MTRRLRPPATAEAGKQRPSSRRRESLLVVTVALVSMLAPLNSTMIAVALPRIMQELGAEITQASWLVSGYLITMAAIQPVAGRIGDRFGRRRLILWGIALFGAVSLGAALSSSVLQLLVFRILQALSAAVALPNGTALIREFVPAERRASQLGFIGSAISLAAVAGPLVAGFALDLGDWQAIFTVNVLLVVPALLGGWLAIPTDEIRAGKAPFDLAGSVALALLLVGLVGVLNAIPEHNRGDSRLLVGGLTLLAPAVSGFIWYESRHAAPVLPPQIFRHVPFLAANGAVATSNLAMYLVLLTVPMLLADQPGWDGASTGLTLAALPAVMLIFAPVGGLLADKWGRRWPTVLGMTLLTLGTMTLTLSGGTNSVASLLAALGLIGTGIGLSSAGMQTVALESVSAHEAGMASGVYSTSRYLGSITGASLLPVLIKTDMQFDSVFWFVTGAAILAILWSLLLPDRSTT